MYIQCSGVLQGKETSIRVLCGFIFFCVKMWEFLQHFYTQLSSWHPSSSVGKWQTCVYVTGCCHKKPLLVPGGRAFVWPTVQQVQRYKMSRLVFFPLASLLTSPLFTKPVFDSCQRPCKKELRYLHTEPPFERVCVGGFVMVF